MVRKYDGKDLAKVLLYHGIVYNTTSSQFSIVCPFHDDINPSMRVDLQDGSFYCFGCGISGNAYDFVKYAYPELNDLQVCVLLEQIINSNDVKDITVRYKKRRRGENKQSLNEAHDYYYGLRITDWNNIKTKEESEILSYMKKRGFDKRALNVSMCKSNCSIPYPILFPILDNGDFRGWVARTMNENVEKKRKYLYNEGFYKRNTLCGNYKNNSIVFICEGFMDYLSLRTRGHLKNVVAILGWHISDGQVKKLKDKNIKTVVSVLDNDKSGKKGTEYLKKFFNVVEFCYPEGVKDPGEMDENVLIESIKKTKRKYVNDKDNHKNVNKIIS